MDQQAQNKLEVEVAQLIASMVGEKDIKVYYNNHTHMDGDGGFHSYFMSSTVHEILISIPWRINIPEQLVNHFKGATVIRYEVSTALERALLSYELHNMDVFLEELKDLAKVIFDHKFTEDMEQAICIS